MLGESVIGEEGVEHRAGDEVLGEHFDGVVVRDGGIEVGLQAGQELDKGLGVLGILVVEQCFDARDMPLGDDGDVAGPGFPVSAVAALEDDLGVDGVLPFVELREGEDALHLADLSGWPSPLPFSPRLVAADADDLDVVRAAAVEFEQVDRGVEAVVMGTEGLQDLPNDFVLFVVLEGFFWRGVGGDADGEDDVAVAAFPG